MKHELIGPKFFAFRIIDEGHLQGIGSFEGEEPSEVGRIEDLKKYSPEAIIQVAEITKEEYIDFTDKIEAEKCKLQFEKFTGSQNKDVMAG